MGAREQSLEGQLREAVEGLELGYTVNHTQDTTVYGVSYQANGWNINVNVQGDDPSSLEVNCTLEVEEEITDLQSLATSFQTLGQIGRTLKNRGYSDGKLYVERGRFVEPGSEDNKAVKARYLMETKFESLGGLTSFLKDINPDSYGCQEIDYGPLQEMMAKAVY